MARTKEAVRFRLIQMPCCGQLLCWVNPRLPNYCPECGENVMVAIKESVLLTDESATLDLRYVSTFEALVSQRGHNA